jgi:OmcA/MtrC family decaheme c-type cytochrome
VFSYEVNQVTVASNVATVKFKIWQNGTAATLNTGGTGSVLTGFSGGPSFLVIYAAPEDGITNPSDWNSGHTSIALQNVYDGTKGTLTGPDGSGYYTAVLSSATYTALNIPSSATMVTGAMAGAFTKSGVSYPGLASFKTADGYTARRTIFDPAKCNSCHEQLGTDPNFHGGSYNVAMCAMCHTPNQASSGWSASFRTWVHGIHGAGKRTVPYTWHAVSATDTYADLEYPGVLSNCEQCHNPGTYDFSATTYTDDLIGRMLNVVDASGTLASTSTTSYRYSPYVTLDTNYGVNYSIASNGTITAAAPTTLVSSPITAACSACHDRSSAISHMKSNGGLFYTPRSQAPSK